jgi:hypothetical protein
MTPLERAKKALAECGEGPYRAEKTPDGECYGYWTVRNTDPAFNEVSHDRMADALNALAALVADCDEREATEELRRLCLKQHYAPTEGTWWRWETLKPLKPYAEGWATTDGKQAFPNAVEALAWVRENVK